MHRTNIGLKRTFFLQKIKCINLPVLIANSAENQMNRYNLNIRDHKSIRLKESEYSQEGLYFIGARKSLVLNKCLETFKQKFPGDYMGDYGNGIITNMSLMMNNLRIVLRITSSIVPKIEKR